MIAKDQEVPIVATTCTSSAAAAASREAGISTFDSEFQSLEMEAESELAEIQTMLSMFDDTPATTPLEQEKPCSWNTHTIARTVSDVQSEGQGGTSHREQSLKQMAVTDSRSKGGTASAGDMDIESILQEMNTIDGKGALYNNIRRGVSQLLWVYE